MCMMQNPIHYSGECKVYLLYTGPSLDCDLLLLLVN